MSNNRTEKNRIDTQLTHFPDGRIVTPRKIAAASAAALSFFPPLAAFTAAIAAADFCRSTGSLNTGAAVFDFFFKLFKGDFFDFFGVEPSIFPGSPVDGRFEPLFDDFEVFPFLPPSPGAWGSCEEYSGK